MEQRILFTLDFDVTFPSILRFAERYARVADIDDRTMVLVQYICDNILLQA